MQPVQELLSRIRWDKAYGAARFSVAYYDRVAQEVKIVPFRELCFDSDDHFAFGVVDEIGEVHWVPYHRVRALYRNDAVIWRRAATTSADHTPEHI